MCCLDMERAEFLGSNKPKFRRRFDLQVQGHAHLSGSYQLRGHIQCLQIEILLGLDLRNLQVRKLRVVKTPR